MSNSKGRLEFGAYILNLVEKMERRGKLPREEQISFFGKDKWVFKRTNGR